MNFFTETEIGKNLVLILISILVGFIIGTEREYRNKSAGLRTFILISFGSCVFTVLSLKIGIENPDRLAANIVTGIGFLGAGVIFKDDNKIAGITTATTIWATASLGMCIGSGNILLGFLGTILVLLILNALYFIQIWIDNTHKIREYTISLSSVNEIPYYEALLKKSHLNFTVIEENNLEEGFSTTIRVTGNNKNHEIFIQQLRKDTTIKSYQF